MTKRYALSDAQLATALEELDNWSVEDGKLTKRYKFKTFAAAIGWIGALAMMVVVAGLLYLFRPQDG